MPRNKPIINSASALPKVVAYLDDNRDNFFSPRYLADEVRFSPRDGVFRNTISDARSLSHALTLGICYNHEALDKVSQLRIWNGTGNSIYGTYYGILEGKKPQEITATHDKNGGTGFYLDNIDLLKCFVRVDRRVKRVIPRRVAPKE